MSPYLFITIYLYIQARDIQLLIVSLILYMLPSLSFYANICTVFPTICCKVAGKCTPYIAGDGGMEITMYVFDAC